MKKVVGSLDPKSQRKWRAHNQPESCYWLLSMIVGVDCSWEMNIVSIGRRSQFLINKSLSRAVHLSERRQGKIPHVQLVPISHAEIFLSAYPRVSADEVRCCSRSCESGHMSCRPFEGLRPSTAGDGPRCDPDKLLTAEETFCEPIDWSATSSDWPVRNLHFSAHT
jgi:hypothetical protein